MHKLLDSLPTELCVNYEQSEKPKPSGGLTQESLDRAFRGKQRQSVACSLGLKRRRSLVRKFKEQIHASSSIWSSCSMTASSSGKLTVSVRHTRRAATSSYSWR
jgi:hypothetical protein